MIGLLLAANLVAGTYTYKTTYHGTDLGTSTVTVTNNAGSMQISEQTSGSYSGTSGNANATLQLNSDMTPSSYKASGTMGGSPIADSATISGDTAQVTNAQGVSSSFKLTNGQKYFVVVDLGTVAGFIPLPAQMQAWNNASVCAVIPSFGQSIVISPGAAPAPTSRPANVPASDNGMTFTGHTPFTVWYNPTTLVPDEIDVPAQGVTIARTQ
jgi:hypothetical protein